MILILLLSYLLEITLKYYLPLLINFSLEPMFFISSLIIYILFYPKEKKIFYFMITSTLIYDLFFGNILFLYTLIFIIIYNMVLFIYKRFQNNLLTNMILFIMCLIVFFSLKYLILLLIGYVPAFKPIIIKMINSLIMNLVYGLTLYYFLGIKSKKA